MIGVSDMAGLMVLLAKKPSDRILHSRGISKFNIHILTI